MSEPTPAATVAPMLYVSCVKCGTVGATSNPEVAAKARMGHLANSHPGAGDPALVSVWQSKPRSPQHDAQANAGDGPTR